MARHLRPGPELEKIRREVSEYERFRDLAAQATEANEAICEARPVPLPGDAEDGEDGRLASPLAVGLREEVSAELTRLAVAAARSLGQGGEHGTVSPVRPRARDLPPRHRHLMPQHEDLRVLSSASQPDTRTMNR